jgi:hypothetical protein
MQWFNNMKIGTRLGGVFGVMLFLLLAVAVSPGNTWINTLNLCGLGY